MDPTTGPKASRREFLRSSAGGAVGGVLASRTSFPAVVSRVGSANKLRVGLIGCGSRGAGAALNALNADDNVELAAMADLFESNLQSSLNQLREKAPGKVNVTPQRCFLGFDAYRQLIQSDVDVVLLTTPPGFRPRHLEAAVSGGKHAFVEITTAVDAPGVRSVLQSAQLAAKKNLAIVSGFCWRYDHGLRAAQEQIRQGAIGDVRAIYATYYRGNLDHKYYGPRPEAMSELEWQIRDWYGHLWLSGDVTIVLSGGHSVDKMSWWLDDVTPTKAVAIGSRLHPSDGNTFDNGFVVYEYADGLRGFLGCRSQSGCFSQNADFIIGADGTCTIGRGRGPVIEGKTNWRYKGALNNKYQTEHDELFASIRAGQPINDGARMARTTLMAIMGRMAAYTGKEITWEQALNSQQDLVPQEFDWNKKIDEPPLAVPGLTEFL